MAISKYTLYKYVKVAGIWRYREARGLDLESIRKYRAAVDPFVEHCGVAYVDECSDNKQVLLAATDDFTRRRLIG